MVIVRYPSNLGAPITETTMQAVVFDGPASDTSTTRTASRPIPEPVAGQVAIDVHYAGTNSVDVLSPRAANAPGWPLVPGREGAGTVRALGPGVDKPTVGTRVAAFSGRGGLAEVAVVAAPLV